MLSTEFSYALAAFAVFLVVFCAFAYVWMLRLANYCRDAVDWVRNENKRAVSLRRIAELDAALTELRDAYDALYESNKKLRARIGMRRAREKRKEGAELSDEERNAQEKARLREKAREMGLLR